MKRSTISTVFFSMIMLLLWSCSKKEVQTSVSPNLPSTTYAYSTNSKDKMDAITWLSINIINKQITAIKPNVSITPITNSGITLGRVIFYDNFGISNLHINCNGCHVAPVVRHDTQGMIQLQSGSSSPIVNSRATDAAFERGAASDAHAQTGMQSPDQMVQTMTARAYYSQLFKDAYGSSEITPERISDALAQYLAAVAYVGSTDAVATDTRFADPFK